MSNRTAVPGGPVTGFPQAESQDHGTTGSKDNGNGYRGGFGARSRRLGEAIKGRVVAHAPHGAAHGHAGRSPYRWWEQGSQGSGREVGVVNHRELHRALVERFGLKRVVNVVLERVPFPAQVRPCALCLQYEGPSMTTWVPAQVRLFSEAEVVVGQHGAGLTNVLFSQPGGMLLELCPRLHLMYQHLARHRKNACAFVDDCPADSEASFVTVDVPTVVATIERHLLSSAWEG